MILNSPIISGSLTVTGNIIASGSITLSGSVASASYADTASFVALAQTASYVLTAQTASFVANAQTASFVALAQSASNAVSAQTASFANAFTVASTLTAQTLVVQTITSSVDFITGSTRFGSIAANTHQFTGSVSVTGSLSGSSANFSGALSSNSLTLTNALSVANGGTGATSFTTQQIIYGNGTSALTSNTNFYWETANNRLWIDRNDAGNISMILKNAFLNQGSLLQFQKNITTTGAINAYIGYGGDSSNNFIINHGGSDRLTIASTGAATFSSSVNVGGSTITDGHLLNIVGSSATSNIGIVLNKTNSTAQIWGITNVGALTFYDYTAATERMRITTGGNVGIGTSSPSSLLQVYGLGVSSANAVIQVTGTTNYAAYRMNNTGGDFYIGIENSTGTGFGTTAYGRVIFADGAYPLIIFSAGIERMRITSGGLFKFQNNGSSYESATAGVNEFTTAANDTNVVFRNTAASLTADRAGVDVFYTTASPNNSSAAFYQAADNSSGRVLRFQVTSNGYVHSRSTSITIISSDIRLKTDIIDYDKGLSEVLAMKPRYYRFKAEPEKLQIGFIAQEMDIALSGSMIDSNEKNKETGESYKTYHLEWYPLLVKAIQELKTQNDALQSRIETLESK